MALTGRTRLRLGRHSRRADISRIRQRNNALRRGEGFEEEVVYPAYTFDSQAAIDVLDTDQNASEDWPAALTYVSGRGLEAVLASYSGGGALYAYDADGERLDATLGFDLTAVIQYDSTESGQTILGPALIPESGLDSLPVGPTFGLDERFSRFQPKVYKDGANPVAFTNGANTISLAGAELTDDVDHTVGFSYDPDGNAGGGTIAYWYDGVLKATYNLTASEKAYFTSAMVVAVFGAASSHVGGYFIKSITTGARGSLLS